MKALHVRGVPDDVYEALRVAAREDGRSISAETIEILKQAMAHRLVGAPAVMKNIAERKQRIRIEIDSAALIREDRDR